jgi:hypothetical protein
MKWQMINEMKNEKCFVHHLCTFCIYHIIPQFLNFSILPFLLFSSCRGVPEGRGEFIIPLRRWVAEGGGGKDLTMRNEEWKMVNEMEEWKN